MENKNKTVSWKKKKNRKELKLKEKMIEKMKEANVWKWQM